MDTLVGYSVFFNPPPHPAIKPAKIILARPRDRTSVDLVVVVVVVVVEESTV